MRAIDAALARVLPDATDSTVSLAWYHYVDLLAIKGLSTKSGQPAEWGSDYVNRPLKIYRTHILKYSQYASQVTAVLSDGSIISIPISRE